MQLKDKPRLLVEEQQIQVQLKEVAGTLTQEEATFKRQAVLLIEQTLQIVRLIIELLLQTERQIIQVVQLEQRHQVEPLIVLAQLPQGKLRRAEVQQPHQAEGLKVTMPDKAMFQLHVLQQRAQITGLQHHQEVVRNQHLTELVVQLDK